MCFCQILRFALTSEGIAASLATSSSTRPKKGEEKGDCTCAEITEKRLKRLPTTEDVTNQTVKD